MARLEDLKPGVRLTGLIPNGTVTVVAQRWHGDQAVTLTYRDHNGQPAERLLYRSDETALRVEAEGKAWSFDADGHLFRVVSEARRIRLAYLFDPMLAVHLSLLEPLPHQIKAVYGAMLPRQPLRFLLADDPGAGKTIMAGLLVKELALRGDVGHCLVVAPGGLVTQWQDELDQRFGLAFDIVTRESVKAARTGNPFAERDRLIARLDQGAQPSCGPRRRGDPDHRRRRRPSSRRLPRGGHPRRHRERQHLALRTGLGLRVGVRGCRPSGICYPVSI